MVRPLGPAKLKDVKAAHEIISLKLQIQKKNETWFLTEKEFEFSGLGQEQGVGVQECQTIINGSDYKCKWTSEHIGEIGYNNWDKQTS